MEDEDEILEKTAAAETTTAATTEAPERSTVAPSPDAASLLRDSSGSIIATAPLTPSTAQFVAVQPFNNVRALTPPVAHISTPAVGFAAPVTHVSQEAPVAHVTRGHLLADSSTPVFQGFYSFPNAGINFS